MRPEDLHRVLNILIQNPCILVALGVDADGKKHPLGIREGSSENAAVAKALLADLVERGLPTDRAFVFVIDGSKALRQAIDKTFGTLALIQRCPVHKRRNVARAPAADRPPQRQARSGRGMECEGSLPRSLRKSISAPRRVAAWAILSAIV